MSIVWVASYILLWVLVISLGLLNLGMLQQVGLLQQRLDQAPADHKQARDVTQPSIDADGPLIGTPLPTVQTESANGCGMVDLTPADGAPGGTLLILLSAMCESCQHLVEPLNALVSDQRSGQSSLHVVAFLRADQTGGRAFLSVFPLNMPVIFDSDRILTKALDVHRTPFGLLYDADGMLVRKGVLLGEEELRALLGDSSVSAVARLQVYPTPEEHEMTVEAQVGR